MSKIAPMFDFGDRLAYDYEGFAGEGFCAGHYPHTKDRSIVLIAGPNQLGMPINQKWCRRISSGHEAECEIVRARYLARFGEASLMPLL